MTAGRAERGGGRVGGSAVVDTAHVHLLCIPAPFRLCVSLLGKGIVYR